MRKLIGRHIDDYFRRTYEEVAPPDRTEIFGEAAGQSLQVLIYEPPSGSKEVARLSLHHGGAWHHGNPWQLSAIARDLSARGVEVYLPEYRTASRDGTSVLDAVGDAELLYRWLTARAGETPLFLGGASAGAALAVRALGHGPHVAGLVLINPALNLGAARLRLAYHLLEQPPSLSLEAFASIDPAESCRQGLPPMLLMHGTRDVLVPFGHIEDFADKVRSAGKSCELVRFAGYGHGFANEALFPRAHRKVVQTIERFVHKQVSR
nr:alpha/beta hydrolase [Parvularcula maris]